MRSLAAAVLLLSTLSLSAPALAGCPFAKGSRGPATSAFLDKHFRAIADVDPNTKMHGTNIVTVGATRTVMRLSHPGTSWLARELQTWTSVVTKGVGPNLKRGVLSTRTYGAHGLASFVQGSGALDKVAEPVRGGVDEMLRLGGDGDVFTGASLKRYAAAMKAQGRGLFARAQLTAEFQALLNLKGVVDGEPTLTRRDLTNFFGERELEHGEQPLFERLLQAAKRLEAANGLAGRN